MKDYIYIAVINQLFKLLKQIEETISTEHKDIIQEAILHFVKAVDFH